MRERGKGLEMYSRNSTSYNNGGEEFFQDYTEAIPCKRHPLSSSVGVCAYCLKERLVGLVCSDCGEQRLSSCSCSSEKITNGGGGGGGDVGSVGRISFLLENDHPSTTNTSKEEIMNFLLKSNSRRVEEEIKRRGRKGFWRIGKLFRKKRPEKGIVVDCERKSTSGSSGVWFVDYMSGIPRSRSLCSFRGGGGGGGGGRGGFFESDDGSTFSGARSSVSAARSSGFNGGLLFDPDRKSGFSEPAEPRRSSGFNGGLLFDPNDHTLQGRTSMVDDSAFIDLKFDHLQGNSECSKLEPNSPAVKLRSLSDSNTAFGSMRTGDLGGDGFVLPHGGGGSCRITVGERGLKRSRRSFKSWRWIFSHHVPSSKKTNNDVQVVKD